MKKYEMTEYGICTTKCNLYPAIRIGSFNCVNCKHNQGIMSSRCLVNCTADEDAKDA